MGKKKDKSYKTFKPRGPLLPPNKRHKSAKDYDRKRDKGLYPKLYFKWLKDKFEEAAKWKSLWDN